MNSHKFAKQLLEGPDLPIMVPKVREYDDGDDCCADPTISKTKGEDFNGDTVDVLVISYRSDDQASNVELSDPTGGKDSR